MTLRTTRSLRRAPLLLAMAFFTGCASTSLPAMDRTPLPARRSLKTQGGFELALGPEGNLVARPASDDIEVALGASLAEVGTGVVVTGLLRAECPLRVGDRLVKVVSASPTRKALTPLEVRQIQAADLPLSKRPRPFNDDGGLDLNPTAERSNALVRLALTEQTIGRLGDLAGYALAWSILHVEVEREGARVVERVEVGRAEPVAYTPFAPQELEAGGVAAVQVGSLPEHLRPLRAEDHHYLITRVARGSRAGAGGLRPLTLTVAEPSSEALTPKVTTLLYVVAHEEKGHGFSRFNLLDSYLFSYSSQRTYNPRTDDYVELNDWRIASGVIKVVETDDARGDWSELSLGYPWNVGAETSIEPDDNSAFAKGPFIFRWEGK